MYGPLTADGIHSHDCSVISPCLTTSGQSHLPAHIASKVKFTEENAALEAIKPSSAKKIFLIWRKLHPLSIPKHSPCILSYVEEADWSNTSLLSILFHLPLIYVIVWSKSKPGKFKCITRCLDSVWIKIIILSITVCKNKWKFSLYDYIIFLRFRCC